MTEIVLSEEKARVLGSLIEKELATPEYYPLSLNALVNACNQKTNRDPVVSYTEDMVAVALEELRAKGLAWESSSSRVMKYGQNLTRRHKLLPAESALICVMLLRGPQTPGELKSRTERMHKFGSLDELEQTLYSLAESGWVTELPRKPGQKEKRWAHLLSGEHPVVEQQSSGAAVDPAIARAKSGSARIDELEKEVAGLKEELAELKNAFDEFRSQFE